MRKLIFISLGLLAAGCSGLQRSEPVGAELHQTCPDQRSQVCTREYAPVCAFLDKKQRKQYSNACTACSDPQVLGYIAGSCPVDAP